MAFHNIRFPEDISLGARGGPRRLTDVVTLVSGHEERNQRWANSRRVFDASYGIKSKAHMRNVLAFFEERRGRFHSFLWRDALDHTTAAEGQVVSSIDITLGTGDGVATQFQLLKTYGTAFDPYNRKLTRPDPATVRCAVDGVEIIDPQFTLDPLTGMLTFVTPPPVGLSVTAGCEFDVHVRFDTDNLDVELSNFNAAIAPSIPVIEILS